MKLTKTTGDSSGGTQVWIWRLSVSNPANPDKDQQRTCQMTLIQRLRIAEEVAKHQEIVEEGAALRFPFRP